MAGHFKTSDPLKQRLFSMCKCLLEYETQDGRQPILFFMEKPSMKEHPEYYKLIKEPIDMLTIENNIRTEKYSTEEELLSDFKLMFSNCREYNRGNSSICADAVILEKVLTDFVEKLRFVMEQPQIEKSSIKVEAHEEDPIGEKSSSYVAITYEKPILEPIEELDFVEEPLIDTKPIKIEMIDLAVEESGDYDEPCIYPGYMERMSSEITAAVEKAIATPEKKKSSHGRVSGYILYSATTRRNVQLSNPSMSFGEVSRIVGMEWKKLSAFEKNEWEERAILKNKEKLEQEGNNTVVNKQHPTTSAPTTDWVWECSWDSCNYTFEDRFDCLDHVLAEQTGHVSYWFNNYHKMNKEYQCQWRKCPRVLKGLPPFPSLHRLVRHVREVHIMKTGPVQANVSIERNFVARSRKISPPVVNRVNSSFEKNSVARAQKVLPPFAVDVQSAKTVLEDTTCVWMKPEKSLSLIEYQDCDDEEKLDDREMILNDFEISMDENPESITSSIDDSSPQGIPVADFEELSKESFDRAHWSKVCIPGTDYVCYQYWKDTLSSGLPVKMVRVNNDFSVQMVFGGVSCRFVNYERVNSFTGLHKILQLAERTGVCRRAVKFVPYDRCRGYLRPNEKSFCHPCLRIKRRKNH